MLYQSYLPNLKLKYHVRNVNQSCMSESVQISNAFFKIAVLVIWLKQNVPSVKI